ncbi:autotransporter assembly complex protein TamA [Noviherbaspirillum aerium]|uniref:autotransporter assembly complex protein TamA n=1 Tax=Noviherbaspirillum aerium TaxID=2588497 RepID=UPI00124DD548|nr:autotransporter assembly complex family protein [Noviherbaspirillum aerium]
MSIFQKWRSIALDSARPILLAACAACIGLPASAAPAYRVELDAPRPLEGLLREFLDLFRFRERDDINDTQLNFMVATTPDQVGRLAATEGYFSPVTRVRVEDDAGTQVVHVSVDPGPRTRVSALNLDVTGSAPERSPEQVEALRSAWPMRLETPFRQETWADAKQGGLQVLQQERYAAARIAESEARILADKQQAELSVTYDSGPVFTLGNTEVEGTDRYPESIIRNVNPLRPGEEYRAERLLEFQRQILRTPYFSNAVVGIDNDPAKADLAPVMVRVTEFPTQQIRGGVGYTTDTGAHIDGLYSHYNLFGRAWVLNAQTRIEQRRQLGSLELALPPKPGAWVDSALASAERTTLEGVDLRTRRFGLRHSRNTDKRDTAYTIDYYRDQLTQLNGAPVPADVVVQPGTHQALVAGMGKTRRAVDNALNPRKGRIVSWQAGVAVKGLLTDQSFIRLYGRGREFLPIGKRDLVILRAEIGAVISKGGNAAIPASLLFRAGGTESVRGYGFQSIGNERNGTVYPTRYMATGGVEYIHWLNEQWGGAVFYDVGMASDRWRDRSLFHGVGVGARWRSPVGRVNVDLAYGIQESRLRPHLSLGVAF